LRGFSIFDQPLRHLVLKDGEAVLDSRRSTENLEMTPIADRMIANF